MTEGGYLIHLSQSKPACVMYASRTVQINSRVVNLTSSLESILLSPGFFIGLSLLLLNDFLFKEAFHNMITGKLSDCAGLFAASLFALSFLRTSSSRVKALLVLGIVFTFWKSSLSEGMISWWNGLGILELGRVVDYSDLLALSLLPIAFLYAKKAKPLIRNARVLLAPVISLSLFAFVATSTMTSYDYTEAYEFTQSLDVVMGELEGMAGESRTVDGGIFLLNRVQQEEQEDGSLEVIVEYSYAGEMILARLTGRNEGGEASLELLHLECTNCSFESDEMREDFEKGIIDELRNRL